jgi:hypothetical protein
MRSICNREKVFGYARGFAHDRNLCDGLECQAQLESGLCSQREGRVMPGPKNWLADMRTMLGQTRPARVSDFGGSARTRRVVGKS